MVPGEKGNYHISAASAPFHSPQRAYFTLCLSVAVILSSTSCAHNSVDVRQAGISGRTLLSSLRPKADPAMVAHIREEEQKEAQKRAQAAIYAETAGAEQNQFGLDRVLPKVSNEPFSSSIIAPAAENVSADGVIISGHDSKPDPNRAVYHPSNPVSSYDTYGSVPPPPPGALGGGLVPPPPAVTLSTQAQAYAGAIADSAASFYNNPYFNPFGVPTPPQALASATPNRRPAGLFGEGGARDQTDEYGAKKHKADFVPITPKGMESRSPYKQRDDLRVLWKGALKSSVNLGALSENDKLIEQLSHLDIGLPAESTKGSFNISPRLIESLFKSSTIDKRAFPEIRKLQSELVQAYYRYLCSYNKYALAEQTVAARKQEIELSESDSEKQRAAADLAQTQSDLEACKDDLHSSEVELAAASSTGSARTVISHIAGTAPSVEALTQGISQSGLRNNASHQRKLTGFFDTMFKHPHSANTENTASEDNSIVTKKAKEDTDDLPSKYKDKAPATEKVSSVKRKAGLFGRKIVHNDDNADTAKQTTKNEIASDDDLSPAPKAVSKVAESKSVAATNSNISFVLKNVSVNPRKSVLNVVVKNSGSDPFELNPDTIYIAEGNRKLGSAALRADFDITSIEPNQEVKGVITIFSRPWNDRLVIYLADGNKTVQLKR